MIIIRGSEQSEGWKWFNLIKVVCWNNRVEKAWQIKNTCHVLFFLFKHTCLYTKCSECVSIALIFTVTYIWVLKEGGWNKSGGLWKIFQKLKHGRGAIIRYLRVFKHKDEFILIISPYYYYSCPILHTYPTTLSSSHHIHCR